ncbi:SagB/ThcOx family dehydrogenase [Gorillibacterium timonense]|uniref:SagB/ThcOx family dehydrogenase n=1 Tax=Gorillibacterium timonense TaxID=1689269 RepID=UPI0009E77AE6|nr:SagB/ThcOx family dehydrogenase [Gorillibacterium timonense]
MSQEEIIRSWTESNRKFMKSDFADMEVESDQQKKLPQPPLAKPAVREETLLLTKDFTGVLKEVNYLTLLEQRKSSRVFKEGSLTLDELSFLLWSTQGVTGIRGKGYAAIRPVPSAGARHPFETYLAIFHVEGLEKGIYHYLPLEHSLEWISTPFDLEELVSISLCDQEWAAKGAATFFYTAVPYRSEWRYSVRSHRVMLLDAGHVMQNLYLSSHAIGCGACAIAAFNQEVADRLLQVDGQEEFVVYAAPVGRI